VLIELEVRDAESQQATNVVLALEDRHAVPGAIDLLRGSHAGRPGADDRDLLAGTRRGRLRFDPALLPTAVGDRLFDVLDGHRVLVDRKRARRLAGGGADAPGELREVVSGVQGGQRALPLPLVDEVVEVRDDVAQRAALVTEREAAIHAAGTLGARLFLRPVQDKLVVVANALLRVTARGRLARSVLESGWLAQQRFL
jgi:hypothetical protein